MHLFNQRYTTLASIARRVESLTDAHVKSRGSVDNLWMPSDFASQFTYTKQIPPYALIALVYNTLTEEGLPSFHRLIATHLREDPEWVAWNDLWTAEESRHGRVLADYLGRSPQINHRAYDEMLFTYHSAGFRPKWYGDPYRLIAYTVLQERATQISHARVAGAVRASDPVLARALGKIAQEEGRHAVFYTGVFTEVLTLDVVGALTALSHAITSFEMPGVAIPGFRAYSGIAESESFFTALDIAKIVDDVITQHELNDLRLQDEDAEYYRNAIIGYPARIRKVYARMSNTRRKKVDIEMFSFMQT